MNLRRRWLIRTAAAFLSLAAIAIVLALGELAIQRFVNISPELTAKWLGVRYVRLVEYPPNHTSEVLAIRGDGTRVRTSFAHDARGFIKPSAVHEAPDRVLLFLGGSTTECLYVTEPDRFPHRAARLLETRTGTRINSFNAGASEATSLDSQVIFLAKGLPVAPDHAVFMHNVNDLTFLVQRGSYWEDNRHRGLLVLYDGRTLLERTVISSLFDLRDSTIPYTYALTNWAWRNRFVPFLENRLGFSTDSLVASDFSEPASPVSKVDPERLYEMFRNSLRSFVATAHAWGVTPVLMTQFNRISEQTDNGASMRRATNNILPWREYVAMYLRFNDIIREVAADENVMLIDLDARVPRVADYMYDEVHLTVEGSILVSEIVATALEPAMRTSRGSRPGLRP